MIDADSIRNLTAFSAQLAIVTIAGGILPIVLRLRAPGIIYMYLRALLVVGLVWPLVQPWQLVEVHALPGAIETTTSTASVQDGSTVGSSMSGRSEVLRRLSWAAAFNRQVWAEASASVSPAFRQSWAEALASVSPAFVATILGVGAAGRVMWLLLGLIRLRRMRHSGTPAPLPDGCEDLGRMIEVDAEVRWAASVRQPVTFGLRQPVMLLPTSLRERPVEQQRAVIAHELLHIKRRDWGWVLAEELVRAALWFHPAVWWLISRIQLARESVVDQLAVRATNRRRAYLEALLSFADRQRLVPGAAPAFARRRHLLYRMALISQEVVMSSKRVVLSFAVMAAVVVATASYAASAFPLVASAEIGISTSGAVPGQVSSAPVVTGGQRGAVATFAGQRTPTRKSVTRVTATYPSEAGAIKASGVVALAASVDAAGNVTDVRLTSVSVTPTWSDGMTPNQSRGVADALVDAAISALQQWKFESGPAPSIVRTSFRFSPDRAVVIDVGMPPPPPPPPPPGAGSGTGTGAGAGVALGPPYRIGGSIKPPQKIVDVKPVYPPMAQQARVQGVIIVELSIDEAGNVSDARILRSIPLLDQAALDAVNEWKFVPTLLNGAPVPVIMTVTVNFTLDQEVTAANPGSFPISIDFAGVDIQQVLRVFANETGKNIVVDPAITGSVTIRLANTPWAEALDMLCRATNLKSTFEGDVIRISRR